jgi:hypothetical protein
LPPDWQHGEPTGRSSGAVLGWRSSSCAHCDSSPQRRQKTLDDRRWPYDRDRGDGRSRRVHDWSFHECGMPRRNIHEWETQSDDEALQLQVPAERRQSADLARHHRRLHLPFQAEAALPVRPFERLSRIRSIPTSPMVSEIHFAACTSRPAARRS